MNSTLLSKFQFPWRFIALLTISLLGVITLTLPRLPRWVFVLLLLGITIQASFEISPQGYLHHLDSFYRSFAGTTYFHEEATPVWTSGSKGFYPEHQVEVISGTAHTRLVSKTSKEIQVELSDVGESTTLLLNTLYYPGWHVFVDTVEIPIEFQDMNHRGLITISIPPHATNLTAVFRETKLRLFSDMISVISIIILVIFVFRNSIFGLFNKAMHR